MRKRVAHWLCPDDFARGLMLSNSVAVARARTLTAAAVGLTLLVFAPQFGWWTLVLFAVAITNLLTIEPRLARSEYPELHIASSLVLMQAIVAAAIAWSGGPESPVMPWIILPTAFAAIRFRSTLVIASVVLGTALLAAATIGVDPSSFWNNPGMVISVGVSMMSITAVVATLRTSDSAHREEAILDPLTGLLNRASLEGRFAELVEQAQLTDRAVSLIAIDLDDFKAVNDQHGHATGDAVLEEVAYILREELRSFELVYRLGGEELLVVLPGARVHQATDVAEHLRVTLADARPAGIPITASFGVAEASGGELATVLAAADAALYRAKTDGRNLVRAEASDDHEPEAPRQRRFVRRDLIGQ